MTHHAQRAPLFHRLLAARFLVFPVPSASASAPASSSSPTPLVGDSAHSGSTLDASAPSPSRCTRPRSPSRSPHREREHVERTRRDDARNPGDRSELRLRTFGSLRGIFGIMDAGKEDLTSGQLECFIVIHKSAITRVMHLVTAIYRIQAKKSRFSNKYHHQVSTSGAIPWLAVF